MRANYADGIDNRIAGLPRLIDLIRGDPNCRHIEGRLARRRAGGHNACMRRLNGKLAAWL